MESSSSPSSSSSPFPLPISIAHPPLSSSPLSPNPVTLASSSPHQILTLALPIQPPHSSSSRDDCWSDAATSALIDAWAERYLQLNRGNLRQHHWQDVADVVTSRHHYSKPPKSHAQCKNRIDTLKKKYKAEKSKPTPSPWHFFPRLDLLLAPTLKPSPSPSSVPKKQRTTLPLKRKLSPPHSSTSDSLPPVVPAGKKMAALTRAILRFAEVYQKVESSKLEQSMEMERQRMEFSRELEEQRMRFFMKTQIELSQLRRCRRRPSSGSEGGGNNHHRHRAPANRN